MSLCLHGNLMLLRLALLFLPLNELLPHKFKSEKGKRGEESVQEVTHPKKFLLWGNFYSVSLWGQQLIRNHPEERPGDGNLTALLNLFPTITGLKESSYTIKRHSGGLSSFWVGDSQNSGFCKSAHCKTFPESFWNDYLVLSHEQTYARLQSIMW